MFTLPTHTSLRIRKPTKALVALIATVMPGERYSKVTVAFSTLVTRRWGPHYAWYDLATGEVEPMGPITRAQRKQGQQFELSPGDALFSLYSRELEITLASFAADDEQAAALEVARDAWLDGRKAESRQIVREILRHGWPLFLAVLEKETNRGTT